MASLQSECGGCSEKNNDIILYPSTSSFYRNLMLAASGEKILFNEVYGIRIPGNLEIECNEIRCKRSYVLSMCEDS